MNESLVSSAATDNKFAKGQDGWLFLDNDSNGVNEQISGRIVLSEKKLLRWRLLLEMRAAWLKAQGISYYYLIAPSKGCVYPEYLPPSLSISKNRCVNQIRQYLSAQSASIMPIYPIEAMKAAKARNAPYPKKDTHWNQFGAFIAYQALAEQMASQHRIRVLTEADVEFKSSTIKYSDLGTKIGSPTDETVSGIVTSKFSRIVFHNKIRTRGKLVVFENRKYEYLPKGVIFRDSFSNMMLGFLAESFSRLVVVWQPTIDYSIVLKEKPDIVINQQAERFIPRIPNDLIGESNEEIVQSKMMVQEGIE